MDTETTSLQLTTAIMPVTSVFVLPVLLRLAGGLAAGASVLDALIGLGLVASAVRKGLLPPAAPWRPPNTEIYSV